MAICCSSERAEEHEINLTRRTLALGAMSLLGSTCLGSLARAEWDGFGGLDDTWTIPPVKIATS